MKKFACTLLTVILLFVSLGCQNKQNFIFLKNENKENMLPCYTFELYNVEQIEVKMTNNQSELFSIPLTGVTYGQNISDQGTILFEEYENENSFKGIIAVYDSEKIDSHSNLMIKDLDINIVDYEIIEINNELEVDKSETVALFSLQSDSQIYDIYLEISFYE